MRTYRRCMEFRRLLYGDREQYPLIPTSVYGKKYPKGYEKAIETITIEEIMAKTEAILSDLTEEK